MFELLLYAGISQQAYLGKLALSHVFSTLNVFIRNVEKKYERINRKISYKD